MAYVSGGGAAAPGSTFVALRRAATKPTTAPGPPAWNSLAAAAAPPPAAPAAPAPGGLPAPYTDQQITAKATGELSPIIAAITSAIGKGTSSASTAIGGYANDLASKLGQVDYGAPYTQAEGQQAAVDAALQQSLTGGGTQLASDLSAKLAQIGEPGVVGQVGDQLAAQGAAAGNTQLASGSSSLSDLIANAASARGYGTKLPGIAGLAGLQDISAAQQAGQQNVANQTSTVEQQLPGILSDLRSQSDARANNIATDTYRSQTLAASKASSAATLKANAVRTKAALILANGVDPATGTLTPGASKALTKLIGVAGLTGVSASTATTAANDAVTQKQRDETLSIELQRVQDSESKTATAAAPRINAAISKTLGYRSDQYGNPWGGKITLLPGYGYNAHGQIVKTSTSSTSKTHGLSALETAKLRGNALNIAENAALGGKYALDKTLPPNGQRGGFSSKGQPLPKVNRGQALSELRQSGIPDWIALPAVNNYYGGPHAVADAKKFFAFLGGGS